MVRTPCPTPCLTQQETAQAGDSFFVHNDRQVPETSVESRGGTRPMQAHCWTHEGWYHKTGPKTTTYLDTDFDCFFFVCFSPNKSILSSVTSINQSSFIQWLNSQFYPSSVKNQYPLVLLFLHVWCCTGYDVIVMYYVHLLARIQCAHTPYWHYWNVVVSQHCQLIKCWL